MIGMTVGAVGSECHYHLRTHAPHRRRDACGRVAGVGAIELAVAVAEHQTLGDAQHSGGGTQLTLPNLRQRGGTWMQGMSAGMSPKASCIAQGRGDDERADAAGRGTSPGFRRIPTTRRPDARARPSNGVSP